MPKPAQDGNRFVQPASLEFQAGGIQGRASSSLLRAPPLLKLPGKFEEGWVFLQLGLYSHRANSNFHLMIAKIVFKTKFPEMI